MVAEHALLNHFYYVTPICTRILEPTKSTFQTAFLVVQLILQVRGSDQHTDTQGSEQTEKP